MIFMILEIYFEAVRQDTRFEHLDIKPQYQSLSSAGGVRCVPY
jgi:hypothetical protein